MYPVWLLRAGFFVFGLLFGSFLNVCIYRLPRGLSVVFPGSACPQCHHPIGAFDNIPVLSWLLLGGRCRHCRAAITPRYAIVELTCALLFLFSILRANTIADAVKSAVLCFLLLGLTFTDAETHILPDAMTLNGLVIAILFSAFTLVPGPAYFLFPLNPAGLTVTQLQWQLAARSACNAFLGAALGAGFLFFMGALYRRLRKVEGMGLGDVKLMGMVGAFIGPVLTIFVLCTASLLGAFFGLFVLLNVYRKRLRRYRPLLATGASARSWAAAQVVLRGMEIPFGVFLSMMSLLAWFYGAQIIRAYLALFFV